MSYSLDERRLARCPACGHEGLVPRAISTAARLRCRTCGESALVRECVGEKPCLHRKPSRAAAQKATAARAVLDRLGDHDFDDPLRDLWAAG
jgi:hypothetical protein